MLNQKKAASPTQHLLTHSVSKRVTQAFVALSLGITLQACQKAETAQPSLPNASVGATEMNSLHKAFAKALVVALKNEPEMRSFLKNEANKQFDKDYDVLYQMIKDKPVAGGASFREVLNKYISEKELLEIELKSPLMTIFIPTLPNGFNSEAWHVQSEAPLVAVSLRANSEIPYYTTTGEQGVFAPGEVPIVPTLVIKQNERVVAKNGASHKSQEASLEFYSNEQFTYMFGDKEFDGIHPSAPRVTKSNISNRSADPSSIDPKVIDAFNLNGADPNIRWQRDYVYYGISPTNSRGSLDRNYCEFIKTMKFNPGAFGSMSDQSEDPKTQTRTIPVLQGSLWTEGKLELMIAVFVNAKNGLGTEYKRMRSVRPEELFDVTYTLSTFNVKTTTITSKEYLANIDIVPWDLDNYGMAWKFVFYELDASETRTYTTSNTSTYATNFEVNASIGDKEKVGAKYGITNTTSSLNSYTIVRNLDDDYLGEAALTFDRPIISGYNYPNYNTNEINTGGGASSVSVSVEPMRY